MAILLAWAKAKTLAKLGRKGGVLIEYLLLVSFLATAAVVVTAVTDLGVEIAGEYDEISTDIDGW